MLVVRGETLYDLEVTPDAPDGVAPVAGEPDREEERGPAPPPAPATPGPDDAGSLPSGAAAR